MISAKDIVKFPQYVVEGHTTATYGEVPSNPSFKTVGQRAMITNSNEPEFIDNDFGGNIDRQGIIKTREKNTLTYRGRFLESDIELLEWAFKKPDGAGTPDESRTWADSYSNNEGNEVYRVWKGCKVISASLIISSTDVLMLEIIMQSKEFTEGAHGISLGSGGFADEQQTGTPLRFKDLGKFVYGEDEINYRNCTITVTYTHRMQDSNGSETDLFMEPSTRRTTGTMDIFKQNQDLNEDARNGTQKTAYLVLVDKTGDDVVASTRFPSIGSNYLSVKSKVPGAFGNDISLEVKIGTGSAIEVTVNGRDILITTKTGGNTYAQMKTAINESEAASALVTATSSGSSNHNTAVSKANLTGGTDEDSKIVFERLRWLPSAEDLIDQTEATIESKSLEADVISIIEA